MADEWDQFADAPGAATSPSPQAAPQPQDQPKALPAGSDGGYSIDPETGHLVIHFGGQKFRPLAGDRPDIGNLPLRAVSPEMDRRVEALRFNEAQRGPDRLSVPGPIDDGREMPMPAGREPPSYPAVPQFIKDHVDVGDIVDNPGRHAVGAASTAPMLIGMTGGPAGAITQAPAVTRLTEPIVDAARPAIDVASRALTASPRTTAAGAAGTAFVAGAGEAGDDARATEARAIRDSDAAVIAEASKQMQDLVTQRKSLDDQQRSIRDQMAKFANVPERGEAVKRAQEQLNALGYNVGNIDGNNQGKTRAALQKFVEDKKTEMAAITKQIGSLDESIPDLRRRSSPEYASYVAKVREAEDARQEILDKSRKPFEQAQPWLAKNWWMAPLVAGGLTALALRVPMQFSERGQAGRWWDAVRLANDTSRTAAQRAESRMLAEKFEADMPKKEWSDIASKYAKIGFGEGAGVANVPEFHDMFLPADNPKRKAYEAYIERLPADHPEIARTIELLKSIPEDNPARRSAMNHFLYAYPAIVKGVEGGLEGAFTASSGATLAKAIGPFESGLPRPETHTLRDAAAARRRMPEPPPEPRGPEGGAGPTSRGSPSPGSGRPNGSEPPGPTGQGPGSGANGSSASPERIIIQKKDSLGRVYHYDPVAKQRVPAPKVDKTSELDSQLYYGGFA